ncbi:MAG: pantetheine-phosphate adenylyltransferase [Bacteriovoracaceae bacterium]|nr:pantetheine-phosphate adenylyltransferase [Bacteriovoracaceae bacterium]
MSTESKKAVYAGSFDPITNGHIDIVKRALSLFDEVYIVIAVSAAKKAMISKENRQKLLEDIFKDEPRVKIDLWDGLLVDYVEKNSIDAIVRGLRPTGDFEFEFQMASMNRKLSQKCETVFFMTGENLYYISSSLVKEVHSHGGDIAPFVPYQINDFLKKA